LFLPFYLSRHAFSIHCCFRVGYTNHFVHHSPSTSASSSLQLTLLKSIKTVLSLILTLTYLQRVVVHRSNKYVHVGKEFCRLLLMHAGSGSSPLPPPPPKVFSVRPSLLSHSSTRLAGCPLQVPSKVNACYMHLKNVPFPLGP